MTTAAEQSANVSPDRIEALLPPSLQVERHGEVAVLRLTRAAKRNALDDPTNEALLAALAEAAEDERVRAVALTGSGRAFCVGQDVRELEQGYREGRAPDLAAALERHYAPICRLLAGMPKPTVAVVNGVAAGAGANIALACDLVVAAETARFGVPEVKRSLVAAGGGALLRGLDTDGAIRVAVEFTLRCVERTAEDPAHWYGLEFEPELSWLIRRLEERE